jgi:hypothetical protein
MFRSGSVEGQASCSNERYLYIKILNFLFGFTLWSVLSLKIVVLGSEFNSLSNYVSFEGVHRGWGWGSKPGCESEGVGAPIFFPRWSPSKLTSFDRELNSGPNTIVFRLNTDHRANPNKKFNIFIYKKWVKNPVFRPKLHFSFDDPHRNWHHSIENQILHLIQVTRKLTQVMERIRTRKTRISCQLHVRLFALKFSPLRALL